MLAIAGVIWLAWAMIAPLFGLVFGADTEPGEYAWPVAGVIDGDTIKVDAGADMPGELAALSVRIRGVDAPETGGRAKCESEATRGAAATAFVAEAVAVAVAGADVVLVRNPAFRKRGCSGRIVADVVVDGRSLAAALLEAGHARPYERGRRGRWCGQ